MAVVAGNRFPRSGKAARSASSSQPPQPRRHAARFRQPAPASEDSPQVRSRRLPAKTPASTPESQASSQPNRRGYPQRSHCGHRRRRTSHPRHPGRSRRSLSHRGPRSRQLPPSSARARLPEARRSHRPGSLATESCQPHPPGRRGHRVRHGHRCASVSDR